MNADSFFCYGYKLENHAGIELGNMSDAKVTLEPTSSI